MKKIFILLVLVLLIANCAFTQNAHWTYDNTSIVNPTTSAVTIVCNSGAAYLIQSCATLQSLYVSKIDPSTMAVSGSSYAVTVTYNIFLSGGFEDLNGNLVVYGHYTNIAQGVIFVIDISNLNANKFDITNNEINKGCSGYDVSGNVCNLFLTNMGEVVSPGNGTQTLKVNNSRGRITDISWDNDNGFFIASGTFWHSSLQQKDPFLLMFSFNGNLQLPSFTVNQSYSVLNQAIDNCSEYKALHEVIDPNHLVLYQDLRKGDYDVIWLTLIEDYASSNYSFPISTFFMIPMHKMTTFDMVYDKANQRLNLLGQFNYCSDITTYVAQIDPYSLTGMNIGQIIDVNANVQCSTWDTPIQPVYGNTIRLNNMMLNPFNSCQTVISTGVNKTIYGTTPYLIETYDISQTACDQQLEVLEATAAPISGTISYVLSTLPITPLPAQIQTTGSIQEHCICPDGNPCAKNASSDSAKAKAMVVSHKSEIRVLSDGRFTCNYFQGTITYEVFDMTGKFIDKELTENAVLNRLALSNNGMYIIVARDRQGNVATGKIVYFN